MTSRSEPSQIQWPQFTPVSVAELDGFRVVCEGQARKGGEAGEIAAEMLQVSDGLTALNEKLKRFLER